MGINITQKTTVVTVVELTDAKSVTLQYLSDVVVGEGLTITKDGRLKHWTKEPHGSGTTTDMGKASPIQIAAWSFLSAITAAPCWIAHRLRQEAPLV